MILKRCVYYTPLAVYLLNQSHKLALNCLTGDNRSIIKNMSFVTQQRNGLLVSEEYR